jgi:hypothetical protein
LRKLLFAQEPRRDKHRSGDDPSSRGRFFMKNIILAATASMAALLATTSARSEAVDMSTITCSQLMTMKTDEVSFILTWVVGYMAGTNEELSMDPDALGKTVTDTVTYCQENQEMSVLNAAKEVSAQ